MLLADDLMVGEPPVLQQMVEQFGEWRASILAVQEVPAEQTRRYGIVAGTEVNDRVDGRHRIVEKPAPEDAPSRLGVAGRYILTPGVFHEIATQPRGVGGEIQLTDGIASLLRREKVFAYRYEGRRYDCGSKEGFLRGQRRTGAGAPEARAGLPRLPARPGALSAAAALQLSAGRRQVHEVAARRLLCSTSSLPVWRAKAWKSRIEPGSVDTTFSISPLTMSASAFLAFRMGSGQFRPRVSISLSASIVRIVDSRRRAAAVR